MRTEGGTTQELVVCCCAVYELLYLGEQVLQRKTNPKLSHGDGALGRCECDLNGFDVWCLLLCGCGDNLLCSLTRSTLKLQCASLPCSEGETERERETFTPSLFSPSPPPPFLSLSPPLSLHLSLSRPLSSIVAATYNGKKVGGLGLETLCKLRVEAAEVVQIHLQVVLLQVVVTPQQISARNPKHTHTYTHAHTNKTTALASAATILPSEAASSLKPIQATEPVNKDVVLSVLQQKVGKRLDSHSPLIVPVCVLSDGV